MFPLHIFTLCLQINRIFPIHDVQHLINARTPPPRVYRIEYGDLVGYDAMILVPTKLPTTAILSTEASRMHLFLHDSNRFRRCVWEGHVTVDEKKEIITNMLQWLTTNNQTNYALDHRFCDYEDGTIFTEVVDEMGLKWKMELK